MYLPIKFVELTCNFTGENPPKPGQTYVDDKGTEWHVRNGVERELLIMCDKKVWRVRIGTMGLRGPIDPGLYLKRKYSSDEIRAARQVVQDLGISKVGVDPNNEYLIVEVEDAKGIELPEDVDGLPITVRDPSKLEEQMIQLIYWREDASDYYGADLLSLVLHDLSDPDTIKRVPPELKDAFRAFQALSWKKQHNLVYSNVNAGPLSYGEEDGERELIPEDGDE